MEEVDIQGEKEEEKEEKEGKVKEEGEEKLRLKRKSFYDDIRQHYKDYCSTYEQIISISIKRALEKTKTYAKVVRVYSDDVTITYFFKKNHDKYKDCLGYDPSTGYLINNDKLLIYIKIINELGLSWKIGTSKGRDYIIIKDVDKLVRRKGVENL